MIILKQILWETKNGINISVGQVESSVTDKNMQSINLIKNSRTIWPTKILMPFFSFSGNLLQWAYIIYLFKVLIIFR